jgi:hypothetical protein
MPFDIWITHNDSFDTVLEQAPRSLDASAVEGLFAQAPARVRPDGGWWVSRPDTGEPWFAARLENGHLILSCSYSNHRFVANFLDAFDMALQLAEMLGARVFEEVQEQEVTKQNVNQLLDQNGALVKLQISTFFKTRDRMALEAMAPLEWPISDAIDLMTEYFVLHIAAPSRKSMSRADWTRGIDLGRNPVSIGKNDMYLSTNHGGATVRTVNLMSTSSELQVWPAHDQCPFHVGAHQAFVVAEQIQAKLGTTMTFNREPVDAGLREELRVRSSGLGVDLVEWLMAR